MKKRNIIKLGILVAIVIVALGFFMRATLRDWLHQITSPALPEAVNFSTLKNSAGAQAEDGNANTNAQTPIPATFNLKVPFTTQAPNANWDATHEEACEEASAITVHYYYQGKTFTAAIAEKEIQDFIAYEMTTLGFFKDTTAQQTADLIKSYWGYKRVDVIDNPTADQIKQQVAAGRPVIVPSAGRELHNPNFKSPGPIYHMLVIRGYTKTQFITNDVGTRKGDGYVYSISTIMSAMHDWNNGDVANGTPNIIIMYPNN